MNTEDLYEKDDYDDLNDEIPEASFADLYELFWNNNNDKKVKLTIIWGKEISKNKQILILKKICPQLSKFSVLKIYEIVKENGEEWQFAEMKWGEARLFLEEAQKKRLNVIYEEIEQE